MDPPHSGRTDHHSGPQFAPNLAIAYDLTGPMSSFSDLRAILKYVPQFQGRTFVVSVDAEILSSDFVTNFLADLGVLRSLGVRLALVFGAPPAKDVEIALREIRETTASLTEAFSMLGIRVVSSNLLDVRPVGIVEGVEQPRFGRVYGVDRPLAERLLDSGLLLVPPSGQDRRGVTHRLDPGATATDLAIALSAAKLIFLVADHRIPFAETGPRQMTIDEVREWLESAASAHPAPPYRVLRYATRACEENVARSHVVAGLREEALLAELFSNEGVGTMVHADVYRTIRPATAGDVDGILEMTRRAVEDGQLVARNRTELEAELDDYWILEIDGTLLGCAALHLFPARQEAEVAALFIRHGHAGRGYGSALLGRLEKRARELGMLALFAFTTQATEYFGEQRGFHEEKDLARVPSERREKHLKSGRGSRLFWKDL